VPQFEFLNILFGDEPVLEPEARLYQRLLAGDPSEATDQAEEFLEEGSLIGFYDKVGIPAVLLAEQDRARGVMTRDQQIQIGTSAIQMVENLSLYVAETEEELPEEPDEKPREEIAEVPDLSGTSVWCIGGRNEIDEAFAAMLAQIFASAGAHATRVDANEFRSPKEGLSEPSGRRLLIFAYTSEKGIRHSLLLLRRWRPSASEFIVGIVLAGVSKLTPEIADPLKRAGAAFVTTDLKGTLEAVAGKISTAEPDALAEVTISVKTVNA
jgi:hypothetical protein